ncbi:MAG: universal stress protein [Myxococcota bacterium]
MHDEVPINRVLIAIDFTVAASHAFYAGVSLATKLGAETWVLHVAEPIRSFDFSKKRYIETAETIERVEEGLHRRLNELWREGGLEAVDRRKVHLVVRGGKAAAEILATARAKDVDLIVLGSSDVGGLSSALGSTSEKVARGAHCSVFCVRGGARTTE